MALKSVNCNYDTLIFCPISIIFVLHISEVYHQVRPGAVLVFLWENYTTVVADLIIKTKLNYRCLPCPTYFCECLLKITKKKKTWPYSRKEKRFPRVLKTIPPYFLATPQRYRLGHGGYTANKRFQLPLVSSILWLVIEIVKWLKQLWTVHETVLLYFTIFSN